MSLAEATRPATLRHQSLPAPLPALRIRRVRPRPDLRASVGDAAAQSIMVGVGETYFPAFALALGTGETFAGLVATLPMLAGATLQLATPWALARFHSYRKWVVLCVRLQAAALMLMPLAAWWSGAAAGWIFFAASAYWAASQASSPAWNTWIEEIVPRRLRANFFACRSRLSQLCTLIGFAAGGIALQLGKTNGWLLAAFAGIFVAGSASRFISAWFLRQQSEPSRGRYAAGQISLRSVFSRTGGDGSVPLVIYLLAVQTAVQISGPYFAPYMLAQQRMSYLSYMVLIGIAYVGKVLAMPFWGRVAHQAGARRLLWIGGISIVPVAALWIGTELCSSWASEMVYIGLVQLISGIVWAAYELAMLLMFFEAIPRRDRASVLTIYNFGNAAALVLGSLIGAAILQLGQESREAYMVLFGTSSLVRLFTVLLLRRAPQPAVETAFTQSGPSAGTKPGPGPSGATTPDRTRSRLAAG